MPIRRFRGRRRQDHCRPVIEILEDRSVPTVLPAGFSETPFVSALDKPTCMEFAPDGRLFVCEKEGDLRVIQPNGMLEPEPFLHVDVEYTGERGLVGLAFHPDFENNGFVYVYYSVLTSPVHCVVSRFTASATNPNVAEPGSEQIILVLDDLENPFGFHIGGAIHFDGEGKLIVAVGEDGNLAYSQDGSTLLGKILRIHDDGTVPTDNPFVDVPGVRDEIYAFGVRNPFEFAVQPKTGLIYVHDVGSDDPIAQEEINRLWYGGNYGWSIYEGYSNNPDYTDPEYTYAHGTDPETGSFNCAITGGRFYGPGVRQFPREYGGDYFFTDFCGSWIRRRDRITGAVSVFASDTAALVVDLAVDAQGSLYYMAYVPGAIYRISYTPPAPILPPPGLDNAARMRSPHAVPLLNGIDIPESHRIPASTGLELNIHGSKAAVAGIGNTRAVPVRVLARVARVTAGIDSQLEITNCLD